MGPLLAGCLDNSNVLQIQFHVLLYLIQNCFNFNGNRDMPESVNDAALYQVQPGCRWWSVDHEWLPLASTVSPSRRAALRIGMHLAGYLIETGINKQPQIGPA
jgi:hypothetical protein